MGKAASGCLSLAIVRALVFAGATAQDIRSGARRGWRGARLRYAACAARRRGGTEIDQRPAHHASSARLRHRGGGRARRAGGDGVSRRHRRALSGVGARRRLAPRGGALVLGGSPLAAAAHGFGQRFDLPLPLSLWIAGAGATIVLTFAAMALFFRSRTFPLSHAGIKLLAVPRGVLPMIRALTLLLLVFTIVAGFFGAQDPYRNLITTMVWVVWWVGFAFACALIGDLWALASPLRIPVERARLSYPVRLGAWPAVALFLGFAWAELVWRDKDVPAYLAGAVLGYAVLTWLGMLLYGRDRWLRSGEAFAIAFGVLGRFAPLYGERGELRLRPPGAGLLAAGPVHPSLAVFVLLMLSSVTFDGLLETPLMRALETAVLGSPLKSALFSLAEWGLDESQLIATAALLALAAGFVAAFWLTAWTMVRFSNKQTPVGEAACAFVLTLVPIAAAYHLAHYFSLLATA